MSSIIDRLVEKIKHYSAVKIIVSSFFFLICCGTLLLMLPVCSRSGQPTDFLSCLFTSTSCTCVTGLALFDTWSQWSIYGQIVMLLLIQLGGLGLISFTTGVTLLFRRKLGLRDMKIFQECISGNIVDINYLIKIIFTYTFSFELIDALLLCMRLAPKYGLDGVWASIFIAVSAYCNAGFDVVGFIKPGMSLMEVNNDPVILCVVSALIIIGGLGFVVLIDLHRFIKNRIIAKDKKAHLCLHTRVVIKTSFWLLVIGCLAILSLEYNNVLAGYSFDRKLFSSFLQSTSSRTAGFFAIDLANQTSATKLITIILMFIGASPASTGGGIKTTTFIILMFTAISVISGKGETIIENRKIEKNVVYKSLAVFVLSLAAACAGTLFICVAEVSTNINIIDIIYEVISALSTTGVSVGITPMLSLFSKICLMLLMFIGRVGPISLILAMLDKKGGYKNSMLPEGKIIIG